MMSFASHYAVALVTFYITARLLGFNLPLALQRIRALWLYRTGRCRCWLCR